MDMLAKILFGVLVAIVVLLLIWVGQDNDRIIQVEYKAPDWSHITVTVQDDYWYVDREAWVWDADKTRKVKRWQLSNVDEWNIWKLADESHYKVWGYVNKSDFTIYKSENKQDCIDYVEALSCLDRLAQ